MDIDLIERLMRLLDASSVNEIDVTEGNLRIRLSKSAGSVSEQPGKQENPAGHRQSSEEDADDPLGTGDASHAILAGLPGTFYRRPLPDAAPFVEVGDTVEDGRKLAIIEAMKMMNPVEADCAGRIVSIHLEDGAPVSTGTPLFTIEKTVP